EESFRGKAMFALGYWAGCRVSDVSWLMKNDVHVGPKVGWLRVGFKNNKAREIDLKNQARRPLFDFLVKGKRKKNSHYIFTSERTLQVTAVLIHHWFSSLKMKATIHQWKLIKDITFHDLRHHFALRARDSVWKMDESAH